MNRPVKKRSAKKRSAKTKSGSGSSQEDPLTGERNNSPHTIRENGLLAEEEMKGS